MKWLIIKLKNCVEVKMSNSYILKLRKNGKIILNDDIIKALNVTIDDKLKFKITKENQLLVTKYQGEKLEPDEYISELFLVKKRIKPYSNL